MRRALVIMAIAANVIFLWAGTNASIPSGWSRETGLDAKYPKGTANAVNPGGTGGALTHHHATTAHNHSGAHTHTMPDSGACSGTTARDTGTVRPPDNHTHASNPAAQNPVTNANLPDDTPNTSDDNNEPAYFKTIFIKSDGTPTGIPANAVGIWNATTAPANWNLCDGGSGRPDMRNCFLKGADAAGDGGATGGAATHTHTNSAVSHTHTGNYSHDHPQVTSSQTAASMVGGPVSGSNAATATQTHTHALTVNSQATDAITGNTAGASGSGANEPPYWLLGFIQNNAGANDLPTNIIGLWIGTLATIPNNWKLCDGTNSTPDLRTLYVKGANTLAGVGGSGGSATHTHTGAAHTHAVAAHTHTVTAGSGAGSNETAGAANCATTAHTHPSWSPTGSSSFTSGNGTPTVSNYTTTEPPYYNVAFIQYQPVTFVAAWAQGANSVAGPGVPK